VFIDHVIIEVSAGDGGDGCVAFRREKFVPRGGPCGGDGGWGGDVVVEASPDVSTLIDLHYQRHYKARRGEHGKGKSQKGQDADDVVIRVPCGTQVHDADSGEVLAELVEPHQRCIAAKGGKPGLGNERYKSSKNRAPRQFTYGGDGEKRRLEITLKLVADVGLVGEPNSGKSTLISVLSAAHPKIAEYPFTTKTPVLGIVRAGDFDSFVMVDIPGLIEGAHAGKGMGRAFLRHVERCRVLVYMVDATHEDPEGSYRMLRAELMKYDPALLELPSILALTKCDLLDGGADSVGVGVLGLHEKSVAISAVAGDGLAALVAELVKLLRS
jgi:GTP-binding protein